MSLTRSDVFGGPLQWFLDAMEMLPIYRLRNGYSNLKKNEEILIPFIKDYVLQVSDKEDIIIVKWENEF